MSGVRTVTDENFGAEVLGSPRPILVEFWAQWCPPCRLIGPVLDAIAAEQAGLLDVVKLNIDENPRTAQKYEILLVPTLSLFRGGEKWSSKSSAPSPNPRCCRTSPSSSSRTGSPACRASDHLSVLLPSAR